MIGSLLLIPCLLIPFYLIPFAFSLFLL